MLDINAIIQKEIMRQRLEAQKELIEAMNADVQKLGSWEAIGKYTMEKIYALKDEYRDAVEKLK